MDASYGRRVWQALETLHAVTYFADECRRAPADLGLKGFWMGYFACRAAPMGEVAPGVVQATFFNFHEDMVNRAIPDAWQYASAADVIDARAAAAASALRRVAPGIDDVADAVLTLLWRVLDAAESGSIADVTRAVHQKLAAIDAQVADLAATRCRLRQLVHLCEHGDHDACLQLQLAGA